MSAVHKLNPCIKLIQSQIVIERLEFDTVSTLQNCLDVPTLQMTRVARLGDLLDFGQLFKAFGKN